MEKMDLSQAELARRSTLPVPTIKSIIQRRAKGIELKTFILLAHGLGITPAELIDDPSFLAENLDI